ncbi:hypothetical protein L7F22_049481 [Adiantum nelumboides]|nr:hypothetical protein [Adiantum nelumboides]
MQINNLVTAHTAHSQDEDVGTQVISLLDQIRSLAEGLGQENDDENGGAIKLVGKVLFSEPEKGKILASVELGDQDETSSNKSSLLSLHLKHETSEESSTGSDRKGYKIVPNWKYDNLLPSTSTASTDSYDTAGSAGFESARDDSDEATEEASRPGEYHTNADDFWGGYDEEEDKATSKDADQVKESTEEETDEAKAEREKKEEQEYWDSYGGSGDSAPSMTPDDSGYSNDDTYEDSYDTAYREESLVVNFLQTPSPSEADFRIGFAPQQPQKDARRESLKHDDEVENENGNGNGDGDRDGSWNGSDDERTENDHSNRPLPASRESSYSIAEVLPPRAPESVVLLSPLTKRQTLETYYRNRNQKSRAATKARRGGRYGDDSEDAKSDASSSNQSNIPDLDSFQLPPDLNKDKQYVDPIDLLGMAQPEVGLGDLLR